MMVDITEKIFEFAYGSGLHDAIGQKAFESYKKPLRSCEEAKKTVKEYIDTILSGNKPDFYATADKVVNQFNQFIDEHNKKENDKKISKEFQFGNAQKLINMTAKFMFIVTYDRPKLRDNFAPCHCPLDKVMRDTMFKEIDQQKKAGTLPDNIEKMTDKGWKKPFETWSRVEVDDYKRYQTLIAYLANEKNVLPIEYDYCMWNPDDK